MKKSLLAFFICAGTIIVLSILPSSTKSDGKYHTEKELSAFRSGHYSTMIPIDSNEYFLTPSNCYGCHSYDSAGIALVDANGVDINIFDDWQTSMMGMSGIDPFWRAKVSHEILVNPSHANELQTFCTGCHAPMGHYTALYKGFPSYTLADLVNDSLGMAGVACSACHSIKDSSILGTVFSGIIPYDTNNFLYGPFTNPDFGPMQLYVGQIPVYSSHVSESKMCSPCHTLISNTVDLSGNPTGGTFVEQSTYHEWLNSNYPSQGIVCQSCHMPQTEDPVIIATGNIALTPRSPFNIHTFAGANSFMVNLIKNNKVAIGYNAPDVNFDSTISEINKVLKQQTLTVSVATDTIVGDTAFFDVSLLNKAGHKFPSGYPSRRAVLQFIVTKDNGDTLFASGLFDNNSEAIGINTNLIEDHYNMINDSSQVQIYEQIMGDVNGNRTTVLERSAIHIKDNRIPPAGFTTLHSAYDTCKIVGQAFSDLDFNKVGVTEGTGQDIVHYHIPLGSYSGTLNVSTSVFYQTLPPGWLNEMITFNSAEIDSFISMYANADKTPVLVAFDTLQNVINPVGLAQQAFEKALIILPNPVLDGKVTVKCSQFTVKSITVYDGAGKVVSVGKKAISSQEFELTLPSSKGVWYIKVLTSEGSITRKIISL